MRVLITGDKGFVGSATKKELINHKHTVVGFDLMDGYDIRDKEQFEKRLTEFNSWDKPNLVLHLAAVARFSDADKDPKLAFETNVLGTRNIVDICKKYHIPLVYASTGSVYMPIKGTPPITEEFAACGNSVYGCTKYLGELYVREHTPSIVLRYAHLYGKEKRGHGLVGGFVDRIERGLSPTLYGGQQSNDFLYIKDVARANRLALESSWDKWNSTYNIGTGEELTAKDASDAVCEVLKYKGKVEVKEGRTVDASRFVYDVSKAEQMLGFKAEFSFKQGLKDMINE